MLTPQPARTGEETAVARALAVKFTDSAVSLMHIAAQQDLWI
jgi:hypothetical protein